MEFYKRKSISDNLHKYDHLAKKDDFIEISEWYNGEGYDITINEKVISLTIGQLEAIIFLTKTLDFNETNY